MVVDAAGRIAFAGAAADRPDEAAGAIDLRPWLVLPGMVDLHAHLPQVPNAGVGFALDLLTWLDRLTFPTELSWADPAVAERLAPAIFRAFAAAGTTTVLAYGVVYEAAMDAAFRAAEANGIRAILGKVMMDRGTYDPVIEPSTILDRSLRESAGLIERWHGADDGRLGYAVTPRFAISCSTEMLRESAALAASTGAWWQTHVSEDPFEIAEVARLHPEAADYVDVYDRAGGLGTRTVLAHAIHLSDRELGRLARDRHTCRALPRVEPVHRGRGHAARTLPRCGPVDGARVGRVGWARIRRSSRSCGSVPTPRWPAVRWPATRAPSSTRSTGCGWARSTAPARSGSARSSARSKRARRLTSSSIDPARVAPLDGQPADDDPADLMSRLIFRAHPDMVRGAWVRGRRLAAAVDSAG